MKNDMDPGTKDFQKHTHIYIKIIIKLPRKKKIDRTRNSILLNLRP